MTGERGGTDGRVRAARRWAKVLVVAGAVLFALAVAEAALRAVGYAYPFFYAPDPVTGWSLRPGMGGRYRKEGGAYVRVNSDGLRDREHSKQKPAGTVRVAVLGDSYAEALQVRQEAAFWAVMERRLRACPRFAGREVEVVNFGVSGYGTAQELLTLRTKVWDYSPDIVLLAVTTNNDITDNSRALKGTDEIPYFVYRGEELVPDESFRETAAFRLRSSAPARLGMWLRDNLRVVQLVLHAHAAVKTAIAARRERPGARPALALAFWQGATNGTEVAAAASATEEPDLANMVHREPASGVWQEAWRVTEGLILKIRDEVKGHGAEFLLVTLSNPVQVFPDETFRRRYAERHGVEDLLYPDKRIKALGERESFAVFNLAPALQRHADESKVFLHGFGRDLGNGHWNEAGHSVAGELIAEKICEGAAR